MADTITQTSTISMEIINSEQYKRANIRFSGIPNEKVRTELKNEGWLYSRNHNVWYPRNIAAENSMEFAKHIKEAYFPEPHEEVKIITEASEKDELAFMIQSGSTLKEILSKLSDMYGENAVNEAFKEAGNQLEITKDERTELALQKKNSGEVFIIHKTDDYWDFTLYDRDLSDIDGGTTQDSNYSITDDMDIKNDAKIILDEFFSEEDFSVWEEIDYNQVEKAIDYTEASDLAAEARAEIRKDIEETEPSFNINGTTYTQREIESLLEEDLQMIFRELVPEPYIEGVRLYKNPEKDEKISLLVQYGTNETEGFWREDALFDALIDEHLTFNGMTVDVNPITPTKSGTIEEYLARLERSKTAPQVDTLLKILVPLGYKLDIVPLQ